MNNREFLALLGELYPNETWPKPLHLLQGAQKVKAGESLDEAAAAVGTQRRFLEPVIKADDPLRLVLEASPTQIEREFRERAYRQLGQLVVGRAAEVAFEEIYREDMEGSEMELRDLRESRSDTDYRLYNGGGKPVYRLNIKFHGALFRNASEVVGLEPEDCFALATYKIHGALKKQEEEHLPYIFVIVGERSLSGEGVGKTIPSRFIDAAAYYYQSEKTKAIRDFEDRVVEHLVRTEDTSFQETRKRILAADWYILSARRADRLVHDHLYDRVFALRVRNFTQTYRGAEVDMHFSLSKDLTPLPLFLETLRDQGHTAVVSRLERGDF